MVWATGCYFPVRGVGWRRKPWAECSQDSSAHWTLLGSWMWAATNASRGWPQLMVVMPSWRKSGEKTYEHHIPVFGPCLCEWSCSCHQTRKGRGHQGLWPSITFQHTGLWAFFFFFFPCLSFALSGLIASVCNSGSKLIFESTLSLFSPRYRGSLH